MTRAARIEEVSMRNKSQYPPVTLAGTEVRPLVSRAVEGMEYRIFVAFPKGYDASSERYPALYFLDAWDRFGIVTETYRLLRWFDDIVPLLIVGISYEADDAKHALNIFQRQGENIDLLFTDIVMPGMSGKQLKEQLKGANPGLRVLYMTGHNDEIIDMHGCLSTDAPLLQKPFSSRELSWKVREILDA